MTYNTNTDITTSQQLLTLWNMMRAYSELAYADKLTDDQHVRYLEAIKNAADGLPTLTPKVVASLIGFSNEDLIWDHSEMHISKLALSAANATGVDHLVWFTTEVRKLQKKSAARYLRETAPIHGPWVPLEPGEKVILSSGSNDWHFYHWRPHKEADLGLPEGSTYTEKAGSDNYQQILKPKFLEGATICTGLSDYPVYWVPILNGYLQKGATSSPYRFSATLTL